MSGEDTQHLTDFEQGPDPMYVARIVRDETGEVIRESPPTNRRQAEKIAAGMSINLNWDKYSIEVVRVAR